MIPGLSKAMYLCFLSQALLMWLCGKVRSYFSGAHTPVICVRGQLGKCPLWENKPIGKCCPIFLWENSGKITWSKASGYSFSLRLESNRQPGNFQVLHKLNATECCQYGAPRTRTASESSDLYQEDADWVEKKTEVRHSGNLTVTSQHLLHLHIV